MIQQIPNLISVLRLLLVPWFAMLLLEQRFDLALILFILMAYRMLWTVCWHAS